MKAITTHVLDIALGRPAAGVAVVLARQAGAGFDEIGRAVTDADGRVSAFPGADELTAGTHRLTFATAAYFRKRDVVPFHPQVAIDFTVADPAEHHHVPLLLSPFGYTTYRGS